MDVTTAITDFEQAALNATSNKLGPHVNAKACFYHLTQSTWREIQSLGPSNRYNEDDDIKYFCGMLDGLAFLPVDRVSGGVDDIKDNTPDGLEDLVDYFDATYVTVTYRRNGQTRQYPGPVTMPVRRIPPLFPPEKWNVNLATIDNKDRTNHLCESWNRGLQQLVDYSHPTETFINDSEISVLILEMAIRHWRKCSEALGIIYLYDMTTVQEVTCEVAEMPPVLLPGCSVPLPRDYWVTYGVWLLLHLTGSPPTPPLAPLPPTGSPPPHSLPTASPPASPSPHQVPSSPRAPPGSPPTPDPSPLAPPISSPRPPPTGSLLPSPSLLSTAPPSPPAPPSPAPLPTCSPLPLLPHRLPSPAPDNTKHIRNPRHVTKL
ncbi:hypothetical protein Hamer_G010959 [Homarus americanus]|uniref:Uncharacterized protein n=1 Tax=Homarus americanus TaxID=6706 RepID=A0A8J5MVN4_HOMAM|nr:hypothetical protein Hamer_G010959 [Homarus americanus]